MSTTNLNYTPNYVLMKLIVVCIFFAINYFSTIAQVKISFKEPPLYIKERTGQQPTYSGTYNDHGYLLIDKITSSVVMVSEKTGERNKYEFTEFKVVAGVGHYLSFGINVDGSVFNFIPEDNLLIFGFKSNSLIGIVLTLEQRNSLIKEMRR